MPRRTVCNTVAPALCNDSLPSMIETRTWRCDNRARLRAAVDEIMHLNPSPESPIELVVRSPRKEKTHAQRSLWHAVLDEFGNALGYPRGQMKVVVKRLYYGSEWVTLPDGTKHEVIEESENEDRAGYGRLIDFTLQLAAEQNVPIRDPR